MNGSSGDLASDSQRESEESMIESHFLQVWRQANKAGSAAAGRKENTKSNSSDGRRSMAP